MELFILIAQCDQESSSTLISFRKVKTGRHLTRLMNANKFGGLQKILHLCGAMMLWVSASKTDGGYHR